MTKIEDNYKFAVAYRRSIADFNDFDISQLHSMPKFFNWVTCKVEKDSEFLMYLAGGDDAVAMRFFWNNCYESFSTKLWANICKDVSGIVVDIGSHTGVYSLAALASGAKNVVSFEPNFMNFSRLLMNLKGNGHNISNAFMLGVGDVNGPDYLSISTNIDYLSTGGQVGARKNCLNFPINVVALDNFFDIDSTKIDLIKIDVENFEDKVLNGGKKIIEKNKPIIFFECLNDSIGDLIYDHLNPLGYHFWEIDDLENSVNNISKITAHYNSDGKIKMSKLNRIASCLPIFDN